MGGREGGRGRSGGRGQREEGRERGRQKEKRGSPTSSQVIKGTVFKVAWAKDNWALTKHRSAGTKVERS